MTAVVHLGDCLEVMKTLESGSAQTCVTSPPYWNLRDYGNDAQIGLEGTPEAYIKKLVTLFREVRRVLRDDGTLFLNLGDSYGPDKNLLGIPWRVALALQGDGWILRQDIIWHKPNPMPESVTDRCTKAHEYVFLLSKSPRYYYNAAAIKEPVTASTVARLAQDIDNQRGSDRVPGKTNGPMKAVRSKRDSFRRDGSKRAEVMPGQSMGTHRPDREESSYALDTRNKRSVWTVATRGFREAHFATMPVELAETCILAGSRPGDTVLDPFMGAGTTAYAALKHQRNAVGAELNPDYIAICQRRLAPLLAQPALLGAS